MNFQRLIGILTKSQDNTTFDGIVGYDNIKRIFRMALESESTTHILLTGPPASAKTMFLQSLLQHLKNSYFVDGGNATKAGIIDYLFENRPRYLFIDEADKLAQKHQTFLLNLMETGIISETKYAKTRETKMDTLVFATSNDPRKLSPALLSRFFVVHVEPYTYDQFYEITLSLLRIQSKIAPTIAAAVWNTSKNLRDCVRIGRLARTEEDVEFLVDKFICGGVGN
jgi:replication-associated recombination protein RarA